MAHSRLKELEIHLRPASSLPDLTCPDGEVAQFTNVPWLEAMVNDSSNKPNGSGSSSGNSPVPTILSLNKSLQSTLLPPGATLLAIHSPAALHGDHRLLILTAPDSLAILDPSDSSLSYIPASVSQKFGTIRQAVPFDDFILLLSEKGLHWLIFNPSSLQYSLAETAPAPPQVDFRLDPVPLSGYSTSPGTWPKLEVAVDVPLSMGVSESMFHNWLDEGLERGVSEEVKFLVFRAVGKAVVDYEASVAARGLFLTSPRCVASFDGVLPSYPQFPKLENSAVYDTPSARLFSWGYHAEVLTLTLYFSLVPLQLSASFSIPESQRIWTSHFNSLEVAVSSSPAWHSSGKSLAATSYNSFIDPVSLTRDGFAFRFDKALSPADLHLRACRSEDYKVIQRNRLLGAVEGHFSLSNPTAIPPSALSPFSPDYADFNLPEPVFASAVDQGFILYGGQAWLGSIDGSKTPISLDKSILASHPDFPFVFRHLCHAADGSLLSVAQANGSRTSSSTGRHPLHVLSTDGIRLLSSDGHGGYLNSRLLSNLGVRKDYPVAKGNETLFFMSPNGLCSLSMNSLIKEYDVSLPPGPWTSIEVLGNDEALLLSAPGKAVLFDLHQLKEFPLPDISFRTLLRHHGEVFATDATGNLMTLLPQRLPLEATTENLPLPAEEKADHSSGQPSAILSDLPSESMVSTLNPLPQDPRDAYILTRPLKLGHSFNRKRIRGIAIARPDISIILEASDNLTDWTELCRYLAPRNPNPGHPSPRLQALRLPAYRYYRLQASSPESQAQHLAILTLYLQ